MALSLVLVACRLWRPVERKLGGFAGDWVYFIDFVENSEQIGLAAGCQLCLLGLAGSQRVSPLAADNLFRRVLLVSGMTVAAV